MELNDRRIANLYEVLKSYAATPEQIRACQHLVVRDESTPREMILELTTAIYNGIVYGNWPWTVNRNIQNR